VACYAALAGYSVGTAGRTIDDVADDVLARWQGDAISDRCQRDAISSESSERLFLDIDSTLAKC
jgi:hypothetical protein